MNQFSSLLCLVAAVVFMSPSVRAAEVQISTTVPQGAQVNAGEPGQTSVIELGGQAGSFIGARLKGLVYSSEGYNLGLEAYYGGSGFAHSALLPTTYGAGLRGEIYVWSKRKHTLLLSPGLTGFYVPAQRVEHRPAQTFGEALGNAIVDAFTEVPTPVTVISPNLEFSYLIQFKPHFGLITGIRAGVAVGLNGRSSGGENLHGKLTSDAAIFGGLRF